MSQIILQTSSIFKLFFDRIVKNRDISKKPEKTVQVFPVFILLFQSHDFIDAALVSGFTGEFRA